MFHFLLFACIYIASATLKTGITSIFRPADSPTTTFTEKFDDAIAASMGFCVKSSNRWDGNTPREYYCHIAPLLDEWAQEQEDEYCWMGVGQFIPPPNPQFDGKFVPSQEEMDTVNHMGKATMESLMKTYFQRYPQIIYAGSRVIQNETTWEINIVSLLAIRLGNATAFYEDWKSNSHCPNIFFGAEHNWGSPWKGKVFKCDKYIDPNVHGINTDSDPRGPSSDEAVALAHSIKNEFDHSLLDEAVQRGKTDGARIDISSTFGGLRISISNIPVDEWFAIGYTQSGTMPGSKVMIFDDVKDGRPAYIKGYTGDAFDFSPSAKDLKLKVIDYSSRDEYQSAVLKLNLGNLKNVQIVYAFGKDGSRTLGWHGGNKSILKIPNRLTKKSKEY